MATNIRPNFVFDNRPLIVWDEIEGAEFYKFKLVRKDNPSVSVWEVIKRKSELKKSDSTFLQFQFPEELAPLVELIPYLIIGEAESEIGMVRAEGELILLESESTESFSKLRKTVGALYQKSEKSGVETKEEEELVSSFSDFVHFLTMGPAIIKKNDTSQQRSFIWNVDEFSQFCYRINFSLKSKL